MHKDFGRHRRVEHVTDARTHQTILGEPADIQHKLTLLPTLCVCSTFYDFPQTFGFLCCGPKAVANPFPEVMDFSCRLWPPTSSLRTTNRGDLVRFCVRSGVQITQSYRFSHETLPSSHRYSKPKSERYASVTKICTSCHTSSMT